MTVMAGGDVDSRLAEAARALRLTENQVISRILDITLPGPGMAVCPKCGGTQIVHDGGQTRTCPQCGGSGVY